MMCALLSLRILLLLSNDIRKIAIQNKYMNQDLENRITVVIPTFNRVKFLKKCLASLEQQTLSFNKFEVIVISDGSTDKTHDFLESFSRSTALNFRYFVQQNAGPAAARNMGIIKSETENIVFIDDDCVATASWLDDYLSKIPDDPLCAGIGGEIVNIDRRKHKAFIDVIHANRHPSNDSRDQVPYLITANAMYRKQYLLDVGGFDTRFRIASGEDPDLSQRIIERGYYLKTITGAKIYHHDKVSYRLIFKTLKGYGRGTRVRAEIKNIPYYWKTPKIKAVEFSQIWAKYFFRSDIGFFTKIYWLFLQFAFHRGFNIGYNQHPAPIPKSNFLKQPLENATRIPPSVSVIVTCDNDDKYLLEAIESVEKFPDKDVYEIIVINSNSTKPIKPHKLRQIEKKGHKLLDPTKNGKCSTLNTGISAARGKYILMLDADNKIEWDYLRKSIYILNNHPEIAVVYGSYYLFGEKQEYIRVKGFEIRPMLKRNYINRCAVFRKSAWESVGGFDENMPVEIWEDWNFWLDLYKKGWLFHGIDEPLFHVRVRKDARENKSELPENSETAIKYLHAKYDDIYRGQIMEMYEELKQIHNSKFIRLRDFLKLPIKYFRIVFPKKEI